MRGGPVYVWISAIVVGATAAATVACGPRPEPTDTVRTLEPAPATAVASIRSPVALPPNADGNPRCPDADAWGKDPFGAGILVTHWSDDTAPVTVLVRTGSVAIKRNAPCSPPANCGCSSSRTSTRPLSPKC